MSRGARGGGRGRGSTRGRPNVPWDTTDEPDARPSELFPAYAVPTPRTLTATESASVHHFLLLRRQIHASPLYTYTKRSLSSSSSSAALDAATPRKTYGQAQVNALYDVRNRATIDPFTAVPTYSQRFVREERTLPDWTQRPVCRELFPDELLDTVDPVAGTGTGKRRKLELSSVSALPSAEEAFGMPGIEGAAAADGGRRLLERLDEMRGDDEEEVAAGVDVEEEEEAVGEEDVEDEVYDDEDAGDYDAENYFDNGDELGDDYGDGDEGEGTF